MAQRIRGAPVGEPQLSVFEVAQIGQIPAPATDKVSFRVKHYDLVEVAVGNVEEAGFVVDCNVDRVQQ